MPPQGFFQTPATMPQVTEKSTMSAYVAQRLQSATLEPFSGANDNNATAWIQSAQSKLTQMEYPNHFWIEEISIQLTHNAGTWCNKWHKDHTMKYWDTFKQEIWAQVVLKDTALMIIRQVKNLTQTGTVKELTCAYEELCLHKILGTIGLQEQDKKLQQFPLIGETAAKHPAKETKSKTLNFGKNRLYTLAARQAWWLACCQPVPQPAAGWGNCPLGIPERQFPQTQKWGNCYPILEPTKFGGGLQDAQHDN
ncbi:hypothetical protein DSO57_1020928 [Entomophthora muscae]|uniref:Uncharacterized protein n=1 Tax=Entomophthora muscae TaxID=34485 RepID=A0ACC2T3Y8_9FUNG|nr:hypothetical protein DSO57_1020928 [Entomophthora muscae]